MKKLFFMAVAAIAALSSCTSDNELELNKTTGKEALTFTATIEDSEATRVTFDDDKSRAVWEVDDQISINGKTYSAQTAGTTSTFTAVGDGATGTTYNAYFPADLYDGTTATLPAIQTYEAGKFNMPMYATNTTTELKFYNLCAVLAITVTSADIATLKSIKVASDQKMNGSFTVDKDTNGKYYAVMGTDGTNAVVLESSTALTLTPDGTTFYIAIPAQTYKYLNIFLSADGTTYTQAMATKKAAGLGAIARSTMFNIDYAKNATKLREGNLFFADCNVGATSPEAYGGYYCWGGTKNAAEEYVDDARKGGGNLSPTSDPITDTATNLWGSNWRMPTSAELTTLKDLGTWDNNGLLCESPDYENNTVFLPAAGFYNTSGEQKYINTDGVYWPSTAAAKDGFSPRLKFNTSTLNVVNEANRSFPSSIRAVLDEAASPAPAPTAPAGALSGKFNVTDKKQVYFAKGNLYYDGSAFQFEKNQYSIETLWDDSHVSNFFWSENAAEACAESYDYETATPGDVFFTNASDFTVNGQTGVWRTLSNAEWNYLFSNYAYKYTSVCGKSGLVIAPAGKTVEDISDYTADAWATAESNGFVFLPNTGYRDGTSFDQNDQSNPKNTLSCIYWSSTLNDDGNPYREFIQWKQVEDGEDAGKMKLTTNFNDANLCCWAIGIRLVTDVK